MMLGAPVPPMAVTISCIPATVNEMPEQVPPPRQHRLYRCFVGRAFEDSPAPYARIFRARPVDATQLHGLASAVQDLIAGDVQPNHGATAGCPLLRRCWWRRDRRGRWPDGELA